MQHQRSARRRRAGMTLIEIMIVVVIMAMIAGAAGFAAHQHLINARIDNARAEVRTLASVAESYLAHEPGAGCPDVDDLRSSRLLARGTGEADPWGQPFVISCDEGDVNVRSAGPDQQLGNEDDLTVF